MSGPAGARRAAPWRRGTWSAAGLALGGAAMWVASLGAVAQEPPAGEGAAARAPAGEAVLPPAELRAIREEDVIHRHGREPITGEILNVAPSDPLPEAVKIRTGPGVEYAVERSQIARITWSQTVDEVYKNWESWIRRQRGDPAWRARAELELARWCYFPDPALRGRRPRPEDALEHFREAARQDPQLLEAYPYLLALYTKRNDIHQAPLESFEEELQVLLSARRAGYVSPLIDFRLGVLLARAEETFARSGPFLRAALEKAGANGGLAREARSLLSEVYWRTGRRDEALALYEQALPAAGGGEGGEEFEPLYRLARLLARRGGREDLERARELLERARALQPQYAELLLDLAAVDYQAGRLAEAEKELKEYLRRQRTDPEAQVDLGLVQTRAGRPQQAEKPAREVASRGGPAAPRAHLLLGLIHDLRWQVAEALAEYEKAREGGGDGSVARLVTASVLIRQGQFDRALELISAVRSEFPENRQVFAACARLLAEKGIREGRDADARQQLEYAVAVGADPLLLERAGVTFLRTGMLERGQALLERAQALDPERPVALCAQGYYHYQRGEIERADELFARAAKALAGRKDRVPRVTAEAVAAYVKEARRQIEDLETLQVRADTFPVTDEGLIEGWREIELYGVEVEKRGEHVVFHGTQKNAAGGETGMVLMRTIDSRDLERISWSVRFDEGKVSPILRLETPEDTRQRAAAGLGLYRDLDGRLRFEMKSVQGGWESPEPQPAAGKGEEKASRRASRSQRWTFEGDVFWPDDKQFHTLEIRRSEREFVSRGRARSAYFDLYFDGRVVARNVGVVGLGGPAYQAGLYARTNALGETYSLSMENFKIYRRRAGTKPRGK